MMSERITESNVSSFSLGKSCSPFNRSRVSNIPQPSSELQFTQEGFYSCCSRIDGSEQAHISFPDVLAIPDPPPKNPPPVPAQANSIVDNVRIPSFILNEWNCIVIAFQR